MKFLDKISVKVENSIRAGDYSVKYTKKSTSSDLGSRPQFFCLRVGPLLDSNLKLVVVLA